MPAPVIRQFVGTIPDKGQSQTAFDTNTDAFLDWQALQFAPDLVAFGTFASATGAALVAANLPPLTGQAANIVRVNAAADGVEFRTPAQVLADIGAATTAQGALADSALQSVASLTQTQAEDDASTVFGTVSGQRLAQAVAAGAVLTKTYASSGQTITNGGLLTLSHGMALEPKITQYVLQCTTAEHGFSIGDRINVSSYTLGRPTNVVLTTTQIQIRFSSNAVSFQIGDKATGDVEEITNSSWQLYVRAFA